jgi:hypothetical protein
MSWPIIVSFITSTSALVSTADIWRSDFLRRSLHDLGNDLCYGERVTACRYGGKDDSLFFIDARAHFSLRGDDGARKDRSEKADRCSQGKREARRCGG